MNESDIPHLPAFENDTPGHAPVVKVWCKYCKQYHIHGGGEHAEGHRVAHCWRADSPYKQTGYILRVVGTWDDAYFTAPHRGKGFELRQAAITAYNEGRPEAEQLSDL